MVEFFWIAKITIFYLYNNTVIGGSGMDTGYSISDVTKFSEGTAILKNNISQGCSVGFSGSFDATSDYNLSDLEDAPGDNSQNLATVIFAGAQDYCLNSTDTVAIDNGINFSADEFLAFSSDIGDQQRSVWDIGADEYASAYAGDLDDDGDVDIFYYNILLAGFGSLACGNVADINGDCNISIFDYFLFLADFGK